MTFRNYEYDEEALNEAEKYLIDTAEDIYDMIELLEQYFDPVNFSDHIKIIKSCGALGCLSDYRDHISALEDTYEMLRSIKNGWL